MITNLPRNNQVRPLSAVNFVDDNQKKQETKPPSKTAFSSEIKLKNLKLVIPSAIAIFFLFSAILISYFIVILAIAPCRFKTCHRNATCENKLFKAKCRCNPGYSGNGIDCDECGLSYPGDQTHPTAELYYNWYDEGHLSLPFSFPAVAQIHIRYYHLYVVDGRVYNPGTEYVCFGVIVNKYSILTSATCVPQTFILHPIAFAGRGYGRDVYNNVSVTIPFEFTETFPDWTTIAHVYVGLADYIYYGARITPSVRYPVDTVITHDKYIDGSLDYDLCIIRLAKPMEFNKYVQPACLPDPADVPNMDNFLKLNTSGVTLGWDAYWENGGIDYLMTDFQMSIWQTENCSELFPNTPETDQLICAGEYSMIDKPPVYPLFCNGFPGSPLFINKSINGINREFAVGISLNDTVCGISVFTNLYYFIDWIAEKSDY